MSRLQCMHHETFEIQRSWHMHSCWTYSSWCLDVIRSSDAGRILAPWTTWAWERNSTGTIMVDWQNFSIQHVSINMILKAYAMIIHYWFLISWVPWVAFGLNSWSALQLFTSPVPLDQSRDVDGAKRKQLRDPAQKFDMGSSPSGSARSHKPESLVVHQTGFRESNTEHGRRTQALERHWDDLENHGAPRQLRMVVHPIMDCPPIREWILAR